MDTKTLHARISLFFLEELPQEAPFGSDMHNFEEVMVGCDTDSLREALLHQLQRLMRERVMYAPIFEPVPLDGVGPRVEKPGVGLHPLLYFTRTRPVPA